MATTSADERTEAEAPAAIAAIARSVSRVRSADRSVLGALALGVAVFAGLALFVRADPATGVTVSSSPWSDEGFNAINARNLVLFGRFATDDWSRWLVTLPYSSLLAAVFAVAGPGIVQARLVSVAATAATAVILAAGLRRPFGARPAFIAALAYATSALTLYYGRLVYFENVETLALVGGAVTLAAGERSRPGRLGVAAGIAFAIAIATKPSALFSVAGLVVFLGLACRRQAWVRRWIGGVVATVGLAALAWGVLVALPNLDDLRRAFALWPPIAWPDSLAALGESISSYAGPTGDQGLWWTAPLLVGAAIGLLSAAVSRRLDPAGRRLVVAALGWFVVWFAILLASSYRPNRYLVQVVPALAILVAPAVALVDRRLARHPRLAGVAALVACVTLGMQGVASYAGWAGSASYDLPAMQERMRATLPGGLVTVGAEAPTFFMSAPVEVVVPWGTPATVNGGDLYLSRGARGYVGPEGAAIEPVASDHPSEWAARRTAGCGSWDGRTWCLYVLP